MSAAAAVVLALAACGSGAAENPAPAAPTTAGASTTSAAPDRQAAAPCGLSDGCRAKTVTIRNNLPYGVLIKDVFGVDNNDWGSSRRPDHAPPEGLAGQYMNAGTHVTRVFDTNSRNTVVPFGLEIVDGRNHGLRLAHVEFDIHSLWTGDSCGWTFRDLAESSLHPCGTSVTRTTPEGLKITVTSAGRVNQTTSPTTIVLG